MHTNFNTPAKQTLYFLLIITMLTACSGKIHKIQHEFENLFDKSFSTNEPGGVILVKKGRDIIFLKSYGIADLKTGEKITENTIFNTGSISKTFVANGILILNEQGRLSLDNSINKYFDFDNVKIAKKIKIRHLLAHCSGLPDLRKIEENREFYLYAKDRENFEPLKHVKTLNFEPGEKFEYSNPAFNGLALIIEKVSGVKWQNFIKEKIFKPAGMNHSRITDGPEPRTGVAHAYIKKNGEYTEFDYGEYPTFAASGNGGIWCSVLDLAAYENAIRNYTFLNKKSVLLSRTVFHPKNRNDTIPPNIGCSWFIMDKDNEQNKFDVKIVYHTGSQGGFRAFFVSIPEKDILYAALFNRPVDNLTEMRIKGLEILKKYKWLE